MLLRNLVLASSLALAAAPAAAYAAPQAAAAETVQIKRAYKADAKSYAEREQQDKQQVADFQGGDVVVIGVSGGALIVLLFLLLILV